MKNEMIRLVVCAAIRNKETGVIVCGPRHGNCINAAPQDTLDDEMSRDLWECGFVDQENQFMSREEAWEVADSAGQIRRPTTFERHYRNQRAAGIGDAGLLFSENLY